MCLELELVSFCLEVSMINARRPSVSQTQVFLLSCKSAYPTTYRTHSLECSKGMLIQQVQKKTHHLSFLLRPLIEPLLLFPISTFY